MAIKVFPLLVCLFFLLLPGCYQEEYQPEGFWHNNGRGEFNTELNGHPWSGHGWAHKRLPDNKFISFVFSDQKRFYQTFFDLSIGCPIPAQKGEYLIDSTFCNSGTSIPKKFSISLGITEVDAGLARYELIHLEDLPNKLIIADIRGNWVQGEFQLAFKKIPTGTHIDMETPDTLLFSNGNFAIQILDLE